MVLHEVLAEIAILTGLMELLEGRSQQLWVQPELILINFFLFTAGLSISTSVHSRLIACLSLVGRVRVVVRVRSQTSVLEVLVVLSLHPEALLLEAFLILLLVLVEHVDKELNVSHVLDAQTPPHRVDLDLELLLGVSTLASLDSLVIDKVGCLSDQESEDLLHALVLLTGRVFVLSGHALIIDEFALRLGLSVLATLGVHDRSVLVHQGVALSGRVGTLVAGVSGNGIRLGQEGKELVSGRLPFDRELLQMDDLVSVHDLLDQVARLLIVHRPDLLDTLVIGLFESLESLLQLDELVGEQLVALREGHVQVPSISLLNFEKFERITVA